MKNVTLLFFFFTISMVSFGQFNLLKDINQTEAGSNPQNFVEANGFVFFTVQTVDGYELWQTDGTEVGTKRTTDILILNVGDVVDKSYVFNGELYFVGIIGQFESLQLMKTNGLNVEIVLENTPRVQFYFFNNKPYYLSGGSLYSVENGASVLIKQFVRSDINQPQVPQVIDDELIFFIKSNAFSSNENTLEVWLSDGTPNGTMKIKSIEGFPSGSTNKIYSYDKASIVNGNLCLFLVERITDNYFDTVIELWKTDGSESGTSFLKRVKESSVYSYSSFASHLYSFQNGIVFISDDTELWYSDGTEFGTEKILTSYFDTFSQTNFWGELNGKLYFGTGNNVNSRLWETDGTALGTQEVKVFNLPQYARPNQFYTYNNTLYFVANYDQLWQSDGSDVGTNFVTDIPKPNYYANDQRIFLNSIVTSSGKIFFSNYDATTGYELWVSNGTPETTNPLKNISTGSEGSASFESLSVRLGENIYFTAYNNEFGTELWMSNSTEVGTQIMVDLDPGVKSSRFAEMVVFDSNIYFTAYANSDGVLRLYKSDGTSAGTFEILLPGERPGYRANPCKLTVTADKLYFEGYTKLWVSDGTIAGTNTLFSNNNEIVSSVSNLTPLGKKLIFRSNGFLFVSEGTNESTKKLINDSNPDLSFLPSHLLNFNGEVYYFVRDFASNVFDNMLCATDGVINNIRVVKKVEGEVNSRDFIIDQAVNKFYFSVNHTLNSFELWSSVGTATGTNIVKEISVSGNIGKLSSATLPDKLLIFISEYNPTGEKIYLWASDGTIQGTKEILNEIGNWRRNSTVVLENKLYFNPYTRNYGNELWVTDGTTDGTSMVRDYRTGTKSSVIGNLILFDDQLIFWRIDDIHGTEPWVYTNSSCNGSINYSIKSGTWNDITTWSCGSIPTSSDYVIIKNGHKISVPTEYRAYSKFISTETGAVLDIERGAVFKTSN